MGAFITKIFKPIGNFMSSFWTTLVGPKQVTPDPYQLINEMAKKAAEAAQEVATKAAQEAAIKAAHEAAIKAAHEAAIKAAHEAAIKATQKVATKTTGKTCPHCRGSGLNKSDGPCPHCRGNGQKTNTNKHRVAEKTQGFKGRQEFFIEGYDKMSPEEKRAAKQAKWEEVNGQPTKRTPTPAPTPTPKKAAIKTASRFDAPEISTNWGDQIFEEK